MKLQVVNQKPYREWDKETNEPTKRIGTTYTVVRRKARGPMLLDVRVHGDMDTITAEAINKSEAALSAVWADFADFEEDYYMRDGKPVFFGMATAVSVLSDSDFIDID